MSAPFWSDSQGTLSTNYCICKTKPSVCKTKNKENIQFKYTIKVKGKYVAVPTKGQYEKLTKDLQSIPGCECIDISKVETRDDLIRTGVDVERMDKIYAKVSA